MVLQVSTRQTGKLHDALNPRGKMAAGVRQQHFTAQVETD